MHAYESKEYECFRWINCDDGDNSVFSFIRKAPDTFNDSLAFVCNFTPVERPEYVIGVPHPGKYKVILSSADVAGNESVTYTAEPADPEQDWFPYKITVKLRSFESIVMEVPKQAVKKPVRRVKKKGESK
jgi:1,4-alpha-glucan branching enzyme